LSEGSFTEWGDKNRTILRRRVNISQKKSEAKEKIIKCCRALFKNVIVTKERIEFNLNKENDKDLIHIIRSFGHAHEKYVPDFIKELSPKYIKIFLDAFLLGDGTVHRGVLYDGYQCKPQRIYSTSSVKLKDDLGELLLKVGKCPSFKNRGKSIYHCKKQKKDYLARYDQWNVAELNSKYRYEKVMKKEIKPYKGFIYDVELEKNHTLVVRRNDNVCVSGNCRCLARRYMKGDVWDKETRSFKQPIDYKRKTAPGAKVKIIVGDKVFYT
jgi:intein/homing endonuclease